MCSPYLGSCELTVALLSELKRRSEEAYTQIPDHLKYVPGDTRHRTAYRFSLVLALYQEYLLNNFLLDRLPDYGSFKTRQDLIDTARKMLDGILVICANRDKLNNYTIGFVWSVSTFKDWRDSLLICIKVTYSGIPSAAILSVELLKQAKFPQDSRLNLPRSEIIQNLSMFIGCLEWVRPSEGKQSLGLSMAIIDEFF